MSEQTHEIAVGAMTGLEAAIRDAATRSINPDMPLALVVQFYRSTTSLARALRVARKDYLLPRVLPEPIAALLNAVRADAIARLTDPELSGAMALRLLKAVEGLTREVLQAIPVPERPKKPRAAKTQRPATPRLPFTITTLKEISAMEDGPERDAMIAQAIQQVVTGPPTPG